MSSIAIVTFQAPEFWPGFIDVKRTITLEWRKNEGFVVLAIWPEQKLTGIYEGCVRSETLYRHADHGKALAYAVRRYKALRAEYAAEMARWLAEWKAKEARAAAR